MTEIKRAIALGFFDGVHLGHGALLERTKQRAAEIGGEPSVLTFDVHPDNLVFNRETPLINSAEGREDIIRRLYGIDNVVFIHFNRHVMQMPWQEFAREIIERLNIGHIVVGHDFCFGHRGEGTALRLRQYCDERGIGCDIIEPVKMDGEIISSTHIRKLIADGNMREAARWLGHPHVLCDTVRSGYHIGTKIGSPTINMSFPDGVLVPRHGVYAARVYLEDGSYAAVTNIGVRPTVSDSERVSVESHLLDYEGNLYGRQVRLEFKDFIRDEVKFASLKELGEQIKRDAEKVREYFKSCP